MVVSGAVEQLETATGDGRRIANRLGRAVNRACDRAVRTTVNVRGRNWAAFRVCGVVGFALAVALGGWLAVHQQLSAGVLGVLALGAALTFFALAFGAKVLTGQERLVYYHHELAIFAVSTLILTAIGRPVLPYLDLTALGVGTFLACGRIGCFLAGCCHGRPSRCGVAYGNDHVAIGFPAPLASVRLLPVQLVEAIWAAAAVALGTALVVHQAAPGAAWCSYVVLYDLGRFGLEFVRGDAERPYHAGFSSAQWLALGLTALVVGGEVTGVLPMAGWHIAALVALVVAMTAVVVRRRTRSVPRHLLLHPRHVAELAEIVQWGGDVPVHAPRTTEPAQLRMEETSLGVRISVGKTAGDRLVTHYGISSAAGEMTAESARAIAREILLLRHPDAASQFLPGRLGVYHLLAFDPDSSTAAWGRADDRSR